MATKFFTTFQPNKVDGIEFTEPSLTQRSFGYECDINNLVQTIVDKEGRQRAISNNVQSALPSGYRPPLYGDFTGMTQEGYMTSLNLVSKAKSQFEQMPANIRARFQNNPANLLAFLADENNRVEAEKLGLVEVKPVNNVTPPEVTPTPSE